MRNLLGRLHARDEAELTRIAAFWRAPLAGGNRHLAVGALYRAMTDLRTVRDTWERLSPSQQAMVRLLALADDAHAAPTLAGLASGMDLSETVARELAVQLYRVGLLAREGDDQPLLVGTEPKLFLPRELALLFRRLLDDIDAGDVSQVPLAVLLERLDDAEIETAATRWGLKVVPGTRDRAELSRRLLRQVGTAGGVDRVVSKLSPDAGRAWRTFRDGDGAGSVRVDELAAAVGLGADEVRPVRRWRDVLDDLESALLLWHTYDAAGGRWLFIPAEIRAPALPAPRALPPVRPVLPPTTETTSWRHPHALAWDCLTLLRELADPGLPPWPATGERPRSRLRRLNHRFWNRGRDLPPAGYVECLLALAMAEGLVRATDDDEPALLVTPAVRGWRERPFPAQTERLRWWWLASAGWIEGQAGGEVEIWGADWPSARRQLVAALRDPAVGLAPGDWYELDSVTARFAAHLPDLLGASFTVATAKLAPVNGDETASRLVAIAEVIRIELVTMFAWLGLVEPRTDPGLPLSIRVAAAGDDAGPTAATSGEPDRPPLAVLASGAIELHEPNPLRVWSISAFADPELLGRPSVYRLSAATVRRALAAGFDLGQVTAFLTRQSGGALPDEVVVQLEAWTAGYRRVRVRPALVLTPDDAGAIEPLRALLAAAGWSVLAADGRSLVIGRTAAGEAGSEAELIERLREQGYAPLVTAGQPGEARDG